MEGENQLRNINIFGETFIWIASKTFVTLFVLNDFILFPWEAFVSIQDVYYNEC